MNIILFGPPGAGKGTQAKYLVKKLNNFQISTGDILREEIKNNSDIGKKIIDVMNDGRFVSDDIVNQLLEKQVFDPKKKNKLIFKLLLNTRLFLLVLELAKQPHWWDDIQSFSTESFLLKQSYAVHLQEKLLMNLKVGLSSWLT